MEWSLCVSTDDCFDPDWWESLDLDFYDEFDSSFEEDHEEFIFKSGF